MPYQPSDYADLVTTTLGAMDQLEWSDLVPDLQEYFVLNKFAKKNRRKETGGTRIEFNLRVGSNNPARHEKLNQTENPTTADLFNRDGNVPWRNSTTYWAIDERIGDMNSEPARIVDLITGYRVDAMQSMAELMEATFFGGPSSSADDETPWGLLHWLQKNASQGFNGGNPAGFSDMAGINCTTYPKYKNYTDTFASRQKGDMTKAVRRAMRYTHFKPAVKFPSSTGDSMSDSQYDPNRFQLLTTYPNIEAWETQVENQNDNLGRDVASRDGTVMIRRCEVVDVPYLTENDSTHPIYGVDWSTFQMHVLKNWWMKETVIPRYPQHRNMSVTFYDCTYNWVCRNRRRNFAMYFTG